MSANSLSMPRSPADFTRRALILAGLFVAAAVLLLTVSAPQLEATPRFPSADADYGVAGWNVSAARVDGRPGVLFITREFARSAGAAQARINITTSPQAKLVYRASADVPFLGNGFSVESAPADEVPARADRTAQIARRGNEAWLQIATFGERRGVLGHGVVAWGLAVFDMVLGKPNDYYLARILVPYADGASAAAAMELADELFPRLARFYASS
jgi:hypothetical protein